MGMFFKPKCPKCWEPLDKCICNRTMAEPFRMGESNDLSLDAVELGRIIPVRAYQTTDGRKFIGKNALEDAQDHQRWLNNNRPVVKEAPRKELLKRRRRKLRKG